MNNHKLEYDAANHWFRQQSIMHLVLIRRMVQSKGQARLLISGLLRFGSGDD